MALLAQPPVLSGRITALALVREPETIATVPPSYVARRFCGGTVDETLVIRQGDPATGEFLLKWAMSLPIVTADSSSVVQLLASVAIESRVPIWNVIELGALLDPACPASNLEAMAAHFGVERASSGGDGHAQLLVDLFNRLLAEIEALDTRTLLQSARLAGPLAWPLKHLFSEVARRRAVETAEEVTAANPDGGAQEPPRRRRTISPRNRPLSIPVEEIARSFGPDGSIAGSLPNYEPRAEQAAMARGVAMALNQGGQTLIEAGTGTGKSLAYLLPAAKAAALNDWRTVISTATTTLQDQLFQKDLPLVLQALNAPSPPRVTVLKGRANYLCLQRWNAMLEEEQLAAPERHLLLKTLFWLPRTQTGDRAELRLTAAEEAVWYRFSAAGDACTPSHCTFNRQGLCFLARARRVAEECHLVIVNHALLLSDLASGSRVLPEYQALVIDEAHQLEEEATSQLSWSFSERELLARLERLWSAASGGRGPAGALPEALAMLATRGAQRPNDEVQAAAIPAGRAELTVAAVRRAIRASFDRLAEICNEDGRRQDSTPIVRITSALRTGSSWESVETAWADASRAVMDLIQLCSDAESRLESVPATPGDTLRTLAMRLRTEIDSWQMARSRLDPAVHRPDPRYVYWLTGSRASQTELRAAPIDVSDILEHELFSLPHASILVSATLAVDDSFAYVKQRLGLPEADALAVGSPFDFERAAMLYVPYDVPDPSAGGYQPALERITTDLIREFGGRTLVLFTSRAHLATTYHSLKAPLGRLGITLLGQGIDDGSRTHLLDALRRGNRVALFGTNSFWEGVDIVGDALSALIMVRLPFAVPTDPVYAARAEQFDDPFSQYSVPQAVLRFKQGFGRLIRSRTDRGVVVVLDRRIVTRPYGAVFLRSLPPCKVQQGPSQRTALAAREWLFGA